MLKKPVTILQRSAATLEQEGVATTLLESVPPYYRSVLPSHYTRGEGLRRPQETRRYTHCDTRESVMQYSRGQSPLISLHNLHLKPKIIITNALLFDVFHSSAALSSSQTHESLAQKDTRSYIIHPGHLFLNQLIALFLPFFVMECKCFLTLIMSSTNYSSIFFCLTLLLLLLLLMKWEEQCLFF